MQETEPKTEPEADRDSERRRAHRRRHIRVVGVLVVALGLLLGGAWQLVLPLFEPAPTESVTDYPGPGNGQVDVVIDGTHPEDIAEVLVEADVVATTEAFVEAYAANPRADSISAGSYRVSQQQAAADAVNALLDPANRTDRTLSIPAGWRVAQIQSKVAEVLGVPLADVTAAVAGVTLPAEADGQIEGWLAAGSYMVAPAATATEVLQQMVDQTVAVLDERGVAAPDRQSVLIQASIVEAEVTTAEDRGRVARVMLNRFAGCTTSGLPLLQMNSTLAYGLGKSVTDLTLADLEDASTPYNTYAFEGLPPTPINSPSETSIDAVLNPPEGDWCYFITVNLETGETRFTADPVEHENNRAEYRAWLEQWQAEQSEQPTDAASDG